MGLFQPRVLSFAAVFAFTMLAVSYKLYHLNNFKILMAFLGVAGLFIIFDLFPIILGKWKRQDVLVEGERESLTPFQVFFYSMLPLIGCLPGLVFFPETIPFFTLIEVFSVIIPAIWMCYLFRELDSIYLWEKFLFWVGLTVIIASCWGLLEYWGFMPHNLFGHAGARAKSTFGNVNYFAGFLVVTLPFFAQIFVSQFLKFKKDSEKLVLPQKFLGLVVLLGLIGLHLTKTRAALIAFYGAGAISFVYWVFIENYKKVFNFRKFHLFLIPIIGISGVFIFYFLKWSRFFNLKTEYHSRWISWKSAFSSIVESPLFGYGPGTSYQLFFDHRQPNFRLFTSESSFRHAHSEIIEFLQEGGLFALTLNIVFWSIIFYVLFSVWKKPFEPKGKKISQEEIKKTRYMSLAVGTSFIAYFIHSLFSVAPRMMVVKLPLFTFFGLAFMLSRYTDFKGLPLRVPSWWGKVIFSFSSPWGRFLGFSGLVGLSLWGLFQFIPPQYLHYKLLTSPTSASAIQSFEKKIDEKNTPYFLGHLISRQFRLGRIEGLEKSLGQLDGIFSNWRDQKYKKAILHYKKGKINKATSLALDFQETSDAYYPPNIKFLLDMAKIKGDYALFKKELKYYIKFHIFGAKLNPSNKEENIIFRETNQNYILNFKEDGDKLFVFYNEKMLKSVFKFSINLRRQKRKKSYSKKWVGYKEKVRGLVDRSRYFGIELNDKSLLGPNEVKTSVTQFFNLRNEKKMSLKKKRNYFISEKRRVSNFYHKQKSHPYYVRMKLNLLKRKEERVIKKLGGTFDKRIRVYEEKLERVTNWSKTLRKVDFKNKILDVFYRLPL